MPVSLTPTLSRKQARGQTNRCASFRLSTMPELDVRGLPPPEPFENIIRALPAISGNETLQVLIHREPFPLYEMLRDAGYAWQTTALADGDFKILITRTV